MALEAAFSLSSLFLLILCVVEFGRYYFTVQSVSYLVGEVAHAATLSSTNGCSNPVSTYAPKVPILKPAQLTLQLCIYPPNSTGNSTTLTRVDVSAGYSFNFILPLLSG